MWPIVTPISFGGLSCASDAVAENRTVATIPRVRKRPLIESTSFSIASSERPGAGNVALFGTRSNNSGESDESAFPFFLFEPILGEDLPPAAALKDCILRCWCTLLGNRGSEIGIAPVGVLFRLR